MVLKHVKIRRCHFALFVLVIVVSPLFFTLKYNHGSEGLGMSFALEILHDH
jgi:hypothetical protein